MPITDWEEQTVDGTRVFQPAVFEDDVYVGYTTWTEVAAATDWEEQ